MVIILACGNEKIIVMIVMVIVVVESGSDQYSLMILGWSIINITFFSCRM